MGSQTKANKKSAKKAKANAATMFPHAMLKEIYEQPQAMRDTLSNHVKGEVIFPVELDAIERALASFKKIIIAASGSSRHAGLAGEIMIEDLAGVSVDVEYSSEYCYRSTHADADPIVVVITQSGETADTIAAQREAQARGAKTIAISNVAASTIAREASANLRTYATDETAIPATKSFTAQLVVLHLFALFLARKRGRVTAKALRARLERLAELPELLQDSLDDWNAQAADCARQFQKQRAFLYLGRGVHYAMAREGALKLKEISYAQAEGIPAGELKHGPSALVNEQFTVVVIATYDEADPDSVLRWHKTLGVIEYVIAGGGKVMAIANEGNRAVERAATRTLFVPPTTELLLPALEVVPLQLFAYHMAVLNGRNPDYPRNLVKSVTRE
jgi:glucosamine--fructose-6-phosphate aminotransferase (isomerizing)